MSAVAEETRHARDLFERVETLHEVAHSLPEQDERRAKLLDVAERDLVAAHGLRPRIAAELLGLSERTVREWVKEDVLTPADGSSRRLLLDVRRVHDVLHVVEAFRSAGRTTGLVDEVYRRFVDATWLEHDDPVTSSRS